MNQKEYWKHITDLQQKLFCNTDSLGEIAGFDNRENWHFYWPSFHFNPLQPIMTEKIVKHLVKGKTLLDPCCGPAYLERLLVEGKGINKDNIVLGDISKKYAPKDFQFFLLDIYKKWPDFGKQFDYIFLPACPIGLKFSNEAIHSIYLIFRNSFEYLNPEGEIRMSCSVSSQCKEYAKNKLEKKFSNIEIHHKDYLMWAIKH